MGIAMQLTNVCRDVLEDWGMGRLYVPAELLAECGAPGLVERLGGPFPREAVAPMAAAVRRLLREAERYYASGDRGLPALPWRTALAVRVARDVYSDIGRRVERAGCDVTAGRAIVPGRRKRALVAGAFLRALAGLPARALRPPGADGAPRVLRFPDDVLPVRMEARA
jgi:phytoene synthase